MLSQLFPPRPDEQGRKAVPGCNVPLRRPPPQMVGQAFLPASSLRVRGRTRLRRADSNLFGGHECPRSQIRTGENACPTERAVAINTPFTHVETVPADTKTV